MSKDLITQDYVDVDTIIDNALLLHDNAGTRRSYASKMNAWVDYCEDENIFPLLPTVQQVHDYLLSIDGVETTRQNHLTAIRHLLESGMVNLAGALTPEQYNVAKENYHLIKKMVAPSEDAKESKDREKPITQDDAFEMLEAIDKELEHNPLLSLRNRTLIAVGLGAGLRRQKLVELKWSDIDFENDIILVRRGKGKKTRMVNVTWPHAMELLKEWRAAVGDERVFVFCRVWKGGALGEDSPVSPDTFYSVAKSVGKHPHFFRAQFITNLYNGGTDLLVTGEEAGHANLNTTRRYVMLGDATKRKGKIKTDW